MKNDFLKFLFRQVPGIFTVLPAVFFMLILFNSCHVVRFLWWNFADMKDYKKFPSLPVRTGEPVSGLIFRDNIALEVPGSYDPGGKFNSLVEFLRKRKTLAFLIMRNDTVCYREFFSGHDTASVFPTFSVSKSFVSALTGIAIAEGKLKGTDQPVNSLLPELEDPGFGKVTVEHLLNMRSGIRFEDLYTTPFAPMPKYYYGRNLRKYVTRLTVGEEPDTRYNYISVNTQLLSMMIEKATGMTIAGYLSEKIWQPMGMESDATWSTDRKKNGEVKSFCCLNAIAGDYLRFGKLCLEGGKWYGKQIIPEDWVRETFTVTEDSRDSQGYFYKYSWRITPWGCYFAKGIMGQYIYIDPVKKLVIVRLGKSYANTDWAHFIRQLSDQL